MTRSPLPNFFILGAGRCGTTSLADHLRGHSEIFIPALKEPSFFASSYQFVRDPGGYVDLYRQGSKARAVGDASHIYLEDPDSPRILEAFFPDARFILIFRNPADRAIALYAWMVANGYEVHRSFERALAVETRRFNSARFRQNCRQSFWNYMYYRSGRFGEQVARYLEIWPRERFYATTLHEYAASPERVTTGIARFLGLNAEDLGAVTRRNPSMGTRSIAAQLVVRRLLQPLAHGNVPFSTTARHRLNVWNRGAERPRMRPETRIELMEMYRPDLDQLHSLLGIDLEASEHASRPRDPGEGGPMGRPSKCPEEYRREAVELYRSSDRPRWQIAELLGGADGSLAAWVKEFDQSVACRDRSIPAVSERAVRCEGSVHRMSGP